MTGGRLSSSEENNHVNNLELVALGFAVPLFDVTYVYIKVNTTAAAYVRNMEGSHALLCNDIARQIWEWCIPRQMDLYIYHVPGRISVIAD